MIELTKEELDRLTEQTLNPNSVILPTINTQAPVDKTLIGGSIEESIAEDTVSNLVVTKTDQIKVPSYIIECDDTPTIKGCWDAFYGMLQGGDTTVYVKGVTGEIREIGSGSGYVLYSVLEQVVHSILGESFKVYRNSGDGFERIKRGDVSLLRLNL